jgi:hypothetical protein
VHRRRYGRGRNFRANHVGSGRNFGIFTAATAAKGLRQKGREIGS